MMVHMILYTNMHYIFHPFKAFKILWGFIVCYGWMPNCFGWRDLNYTVFTPCVMWLKFISSLLSCVCYYSFPVVVFLLLLPSDTLVLVKAFTLLLLSFLVSFVHSTCTGDYKWLQQSVNNEENRVKIQKQTAR